jgi:hypothetical protein
MDTAGAPLAFYADGPTPDDLVLRVNFGVFSGREVTLAETDRLARAVLDELRRVTIVSLRRHELDHEHEAVVHQVEIQADMRTSTGRTPREALAGRLLELAEAWAEDCIGDRHADVTEV